MDTIVAPITPLVVSPVTVLRISGPDALKAYDLMGRGDSAATVPPEPNHMSRYVFRSRSENISDDVLAVYFKAPASYTGEDVVEISFHGNPIIVSSALASLYDLGIRHAMPGEFSKRAFLNGKIDLTQAEAIQELISAKTSAGLYMAYEQLNGAVRHKFDSIKDELLSIKTLLEAKMDFPEEDTGSDDTEPVKRAISDILDETRSLLFSYRSLRTKKNGVTVVLAGKPNVGKSSLLNALLKEERAIVSDTPGTTRDYIKEELFIGNVPVELIDTAGLRKTNGALEIEGVKRSEAKIQAADIVLVVLDLSGVIDSDDARILELTEGLKRIIVGNKSDEYKPANFIPADIIVSAKKNHNIDKLVDIIKNKAGMEDFDRLSGVVTVTERHAYGLRVIMEVLSATLHDFDSKPLDMIAMDLDQCLSQLMEITGEHYTEEILNRIFSSFCIGK